LRGELDVTVCTTLAELLAPLAGLRLDRLVVDLDNVEFLDCGTAAVIFEAARQALPAGVMPVIRARPPLVRRLLQLAGWDSQCVLDVRQAAAAPAG
jgi:anti-anti-sigma factor